MDRFGWNGCDAGKVLNGLACQAEVGRGREHVAVIRPHSAFSEFLRCRQMDCIRGAYEEITGSGNHQRTGSPQQRFVDRNEVPQSVIYVLGEAQGQFARSTTCRRAFTHAAMQDGMELGQGP